MAEYADISSLIRRRAIQEAARARRVPIEQRAPHPVTSGDGAKGLARPGTSRGGSINAKNIRAGSISAHHITADSITAGHIKADSIEARHIKAGTIVADHITAGAIKAGHIEAGTITADHISSQTIQARHISADAITTTALAAGSVTADKIAAGAVEAGHIDVGAINVGMLVGGQIGTAQVDLVNQGRIRALDGQGHTRAMMDASGFTVYGPDGATVWMSPANGVAKLDPNAPQIVTATNLADGSVTAAKIVAGAVTADHIFSRRLDGIIFSGSTFQTADGPMSDIAARIDGSGVNLGASGGDENARLRFYNPGNGVYGAAWVSVTNDFWVRGYGNSYLGSRTSNVFIQCDNPAGDIFLRPGADGYIRPSRPSLSGDMDRVINRINGKIGFRFSATGSGTIGGTAVNFGTVLADSGGNIRTPTSITVQDFDVPSTADLTTVGYASWFGFVMQITSRAAGGAYLYGHFSAFV